MKFIVLATAKAAVKYKIKDLANFYQVSSIAAHVYERF